MRACALLVALAALAVVGCGPKGDLVKSRPALAEIQASPPLGATPAQTALSWWNTLRARDPEAALSRLTPAARRGIDLAQLHRTMANRLGNLAEHTEATVLYTEHARGRATVYMRLDGGPLVGSRLIRGGATMLALPLVARDGAWLIENAAWLRKQSENFEGIQKFNEQLQRETERQQREQGSK